MLSRMPPSWSLVKAWCNACAPSGCEALRASADTISGTAICTAVCAVLSLTPSRTAICLLAGACQLLMIILLRSATVHFLVHHRKDYQRLLVSVWCLS